MTTDIGPRILPSWIGAFEEWSDGFNSPRIFRRWAAIGAIAAACERRVWVRTKGADLFPNIYSVLVGPPGIGKSTVLSQVERMLHQIGEIKVAPSSVTTASLVDSLFDAQRRIVRVGCVPPYVEFHALTVVASEFGVFLPTYDNAFMNSLTKFYDGEPYVERRRSNKLHVEINDPVLNLIGGTTPSYLNNFMPEGAWDQGFASRTIFVFSGEKVLIDPFASETRAEALGYLYKDLIHDLKQISELYGQLSWTQETMDAIRQWVNSGNAPEPDHPRLSHYNTRRVAHVLKLSTIAAISRSSMCIGIEDFRSALDWLLEAESFMPDIFRSMAAGGDSRAIEDTWHYLYQSFNRDSRTPIGEHRVVAFLRERVPSHNIMRVIEIMVRSGMIEQVFDQKTGTRRYKPIKKELH